MKSIDRFLDRMPGPRYNCFNLAQEVWQYVRGEDIALPLAAVAAFVGKASPPLSVARDALRRFKRLARPAEPCIAMMQRRGYTPHCGVFTDGRILHLTASGVEFEPPNVAKRCYDSIEYFQ